MGRSKVLASRTKHVARFDDEVEEAVGGLIFFVRRNYNSRVSFLFCELNELLPPALRQAFFDMMRWLLSFLVLGFLTAVNALSSSGNRLLVVLDDPAEKDIFSTFWSDLESEFMLVLGLSSVYFLRIRLIATELFYYSSRIRSILLSS